MLVKAELLLTRRCNLSCKYCGIIRKGRMEVDLDKWKVGLDNLKALDCGFVAIYGGEPFLNASLGDILIYCNKIGMLNTVITNLTCEDRLMHFIEDGVLTSLTFSMDTVDINKMDKRGKIGYGLFTKLGSYLEEGKIRDIGICATVNRSNFKEIPFLIEEYTKRGFWALFDIIHYARGQNESKCPNRDKIEDLLFRDEDMEEVREVFGRILEMKKSGKYLIHPSERVLSMWNEKQYVLDYSWKCAYPYFVSVDCDGSMLVCDDFRDEELTKIKIWELKDRWDEFRTKWCTVVKDSQCHCFWNTHIDAEEIALSRLSFKHYVHQEEKYKSEGFCIL